MSGDPAQDAADRLARSLKFKLDGEYEKIKEKHCENCHYEHTNLINKVQTEYPPVQRMHPVWETEIPDNVHEREWWYYHANNLGRAAPPMNQQIKFTFDC